MSTGKGYAARCALGVESTYGTPVAVTELIPFSSESINKLIAKIESEYLDGNPGRKNLTNSLISIQGDLSGEMVYDEETGDPIGCEQLIKGVLGDSARDAANSINQYFCADDVDDHFTIAFSKQVSVWEAASIKVNTLEIAGNIGEKVTFNAGGLIGEQLRRTGDAGIENAAAALNALSPTLPTNIVLEDAVFRIGVIAAALDSDDETCIEGFSLSINNNLSDPQHATECSTNDSSLTTLEPLRNGRREITFTIQIPRYTADTFFGHLDDDAVLHADLKFSTGSYEFNILLPYLKVDVPTAPIGGAELIKHEVSFVALRNAARNANLKFTDTDLIADEIGIECKSSRTTQA